MMFSTFSNNDRDQCHNDNNDRVEIGDSPALILTSQYLDNTNISYSYNHNPIFIQAEQRDIHSSGDSSSHEHLMILAGAATVNSSPSNDSFKSGGNPGEVGRNGAVESPHFSIHDPPLIRLSPTSPNNVFRHSQHNEDFQVGLTDETHNNAYSPDNVDWLYDTQDLFVKTENGASELTHSNLKRHSFNNSLSDNEFPASRTRGWANVRHESRDYDTSQHSSTHLRSRKDLKRKRFHNHGTVYDNTVVNNGHPISNYADHHRGQLNTNSYINLTESDGESQVEERSSIRDRLTPELSRHHLQWFPIKRRCPNEGNEERPHVELPCNNVTSRGQVDSSPEIRSPLHEVDHATSQFSPSSPPFYMCPRDNNDSFSNYPDNPDFISTNSETMHNGLYNNHQSQTSVDNSNPISTYSSAPIEYQHESPRTTSSSVSSYLRHILVPQLRNQRRYATSNLHASFRDLSRLYLPHSSERQCPYNNSVPSVITTESAPYYSRRSSSGSFVQMHDQEPEHLPVPSDQMSSVRSSHINAHVNNAEESQHLLTNTFYRRHPLPPTMNTFLRAYGLEEVQQRQIEDPYQQLHDPRIRNESMRIHPLLRISERNFLNPMLDPRTGSQFPRPFTMYESQGNVESVIQLALHLETSWRGISPEELSRLPCHYYNHEVNDSVDKQDKCMVCLDEFMGNDKLRTLSCGHQYHVICVDKWLKMNRTCPMCRSDAVLGSSSYVYVN